MFTYQEALAPMRVLIGCETSGVMRSAFAALGHDVWSCDLLPAEDRSNRHMVGDVRDFLDDGWDLLVVCHPPCTRLCNSGVRWLHEPPTKLGHTYAAEDRSAYALWSRDERLEFMWRELQQGVDLFTDCWRAPIPRVAVENPVMHRHARERLPTDVPTPQIVQPWWFGEPFFKATGFYTRNLSALAPTNKLTPPKRGTEEYKRWSAIHLAKPGPERWRLRSRTFPGVADACAAQWTACSMDQIRMAA